MKQKIYSITVALANEATRYVVGKDIKEIVYISDQFETHTDHIYELVGNDGNVMMQIINVPVVVEFYYDN